MRAMAMLAPPIGAAEANGSRQLGPVDRVKPAMFGHDRHDDSMSQRERERKQKIRSEEHTSELPSLMRISYAVFCLKTKTENKNTTHRTLTQYMILLQ